MNQVVGDMGRADWLGDIGRTQSSKNIVSIKNTRRKSLIRILFIRARPIIIDAAEGGGPRTLQWRAIARF